MILASSTLTKIIRIYAITMNSKIITSFFSCIAALQLALGIYETARTASAPGMTLYELRPLSSNL